MVGLASPLLLPAQPPGASTTTGASVAVRVTIPFRWTYTTVPNLAGFQFWRCDKPPAQATCAPQMALDGLIAPSERDGVETTGEAGQSYCWALKAVGKTGPPSDLSAVYCETLPAVGILPAPPGAAPVKP